MQIFNDDNIIIRKLGISDEHALYAAVDSSRAEISTWQSWCGPDYDLQQARDFLQICEKGWLNRNDFCFGIFDRRDASLLGTAGLNQFQKLHNMANLGYWVRSDCTGRGIATLAARAVARFGFGELGLSRIEIVVHKDNLASRRVAEKAGALTEGLARNRLMLHGQPQDAVMHALIPGDLT